MLIISILFAIFTSIRGDENVSFFPASSSGYQPVQIDNIKAMVVNKGYALEEHKVYTPDGYILTLHRIPKGRKSSSSTEVRPPVLLVHGISLSSTCWVVNGPDESLGFILADAGYDVWMHNTRGNTFSTGHISLPTTDSAYWRFSSDEMALMDLPSVIAYMLKATSAKKVSIVTHSQGGSIALMALSSLPALNKKVGVLVLLAPVVYAHYIKSPLLVSFMRATPQSLPPQSFFFMSPAVQELFLNGACQISPLLSTCLSVTEGMFGGSSLITTTQYKRYWKQWPSSTSLWNSLAWAENFNDPAQPSFHMFQRGPAYNLSRISAPTVLFRGGVDVLSTKEDMDRTSAILNASGSLRGTSMWADASHMDYIWSMAAAKKVYPLISQVLKEF
jgi:pimeloyl-ACP methyl ester carboxylesterase